MDIFFAISDPNRRRILELLAGHDALSASEICARFDVTPQAVSQHLKVLREANLVSMEKKAQQRIYRLNPEAVLTVGDWAAAVTRRWNARLDRLGRVLDDLAEHDGMHREKSEREQTENMQG